MECICFNVGSEEKHELVGSKYLHTGIFIKNSVWKCPSELKSTCINEMQLMTVFIQNLYGLHLFISNCTLTSYNVVTNMNYFHIRFLNTNILSSQTVESVIHITRPTTLFHVYQEKHRLPFFIFRNIVAIEKVSVHFEKPVSEVKLGIFLQAALENVDVTFTECKFYHISQALSISGQSINNERQGVNLRIEITKCSFVYTGGMLKGEPFT
mgnify:CR=1 FL=1